METLDPSNIEVFLGLIFKAFQNGAWPTVAVLVLILVIHLARRPLAAKFPKMDSGAGAALLNLVASLLAGLGLKLLAGVPFTWALVAAVFLSGSSAGLFSLVKALLPLIPAFSRGSAADAEAKAKEAGLAAANAIVAKQPSSDQIANGP